MASSFSFPSLLPMRTRSSKPRFLKIYPLSSNEIKVGTNLEVDGAPWRVLEFLHVKPGKGAAFVRTKLKNYITGNTIEKTFRVGSSIDEADVFKETKKFIYKDGCQFVFMDLNTYEEFRLGESEIGDRIKWLKEGMDCNLLLWNRKVIDVELPITIKLTVVDMDPGLRVTQSKVDPSQPLLTPELLSMSHSLQIIYQWRWIKFNMQLVFAVSSASLLLPILTVFLVSSFPATC